MIGGGSRNRLARQKRRFCITQVGVRLQRQGIWTSESRGRAEGCEKDNSGYFRVWRILTALPSTRSRVPELNYTIDPPSYRVNR